MFTNLSEVICAGHCYMLLFSSLPSYCFPQYKQSVTIIWVRDFSLMRVKFAGTGLRKLTGVLENWNKPRKFSRWNSYYSFLVLLSVVTRSLKLYIILIDSGSILWHLFTGICLDFRGCPYHTGGTEHLRMKYGAGAVMLFRVLGPSGTSQECGRAF